MTRKTSQERFVAAAQKYGFSLSEHQGTYERSVLTAPRRGQYSQLTSKQLAEVGWERGKEGCTQSSNNFTGTTFWIRTPCTTIIASKRSSGLAEHERTLVGKFDGGRFVGGFEARFIGTPRTLKELIHKMEQASDEVLAAQRLASYDLKEERRRASRRKAADHFRDMRTENRALDRAVCSYIDKHRVSAVSATRIVEGLRKEGFLAGHSTEDLELQLELWRSYAPQRQEAAAS